MIMSIIRSSRNPRLPQLQPLSGTSHHFFDKKNRDGCHRNGSRLNPTCPRPLVPLQGAIIGLDGNEWASSAGFWITPAEGAAMAEARDGNFDIIFGPFLTQLSGLCLPPPARRVMCSTYLVIG